MPLPATGYTLIMRLEAPSRKGALGELMTTIADAGGSIGAIDMRSVGKTTTTRDITVRVSSDAVANTVRASIAKLPGVRLVSISDSVFLAHLGGKLRIEPTIAVVNRTELGKVYTPGVARVATTIASDPRKAFQLTIKRNMVAIVTDGSDVLALGDLGPYGAIPVMEGKSAIFKQFAQIDAFPICLDTKDVDEIVETVVRIAPVFGAIMLEDIAAPKCFEIERRLQEALDIPVMHDDQHGSACVILAAIYNGALVVEKKIEDLTVVVAGSGPAATATMKLLLAAGVRDVIPVDRAGAINRTDSYENSHWKWLAEHTNRENRRGSLGEVLRGADVFVGVSAPNIVRADDLKAMARDPIVIAMAVPTPEIDPEIAAPYVGVMATGRARFPNQISNLLAFPGIFRGALDARASAITDGMKVAAAKAIAGIVSNHERGPEYVVPGVFDPRVCDAVAKAVAAAASEEGVARRGPVVSETEGMEAPV